MLTGPFAIALLGVVTAVAIVAALMATLRARAARAELRAHQATETASGELQRKIEAESQLTGDIAHDLNDLLTAITGHTELLIAGLDPSSASIQDAREIHNAALSAARLTRPLRALSAAGHRAPTGVIDVNVVTARGVRGVVQRMLGPNIVVTLALDAHVKRAKISAVHLEEILLNLGIQARDAMSAGGSLRVATAMHSSRPRDGTAAEPSEYVRIIVSDTGTAMSADVQSKLFEPFLAGDDTGVNIIGLAKVDAIVRQAGGRIQVESLAGVGTTFTIDLPATSEPADARGSPVPEKRLTTPVLVVEDEPGVRELIRLVLIRAGHEVVAVAGPHAALTALRRQPAIALMLVDVVMPEMDGYDLVAEARTIAPAMHVVFMSAFARDVIRHPHGDSFLVKPFTVESLTSIVEEGLAIHSS